LSNFQARQDAITPVTAVYQMSESPDATAGPNMVGVIYWVDTADPTAGAFSVDIFWTDPTGAERQLGTAFISLADAASYQFSPIQISEREFDVSMFELRTELAGSAGTSKVSYRVLMTPSAACDLQPLNLVLVP
jgi:hypothetical protein